MDQKDFPDANVESNENHGSGDSREAFLERQDLLELLPEKPDEFLCRAIQSVNAWISFTDSQGMVMLWNQYAENLSGIPMQEARGQELLKLLYSSEDERDKVRKDCELQVRETGQVVDYVTTVTLPTGREHQLSLNIIPWIVRDECIGYLQVAVDLMEGWEANRYVQSRNKLLEVFYAICQHVVQSTDVESLMQGACEVLVSTRAFVSVSVTLLDDQEHPVDRFYVMENQEKDEGKKPLQGFEDQAISYVTRTHVPYVCQDIYQVTDFECWFPETRERGISAFITIPMGVQGTIVGALTLFSSRANCIDNAAISLLQSVANDIAYAAQSLRMSYNLKALQEVSLSITDARKMGSVFNQVLNVCASLTRASSGFIYLSEDTNRVVAQMGERILYPGDSVSYNFETVMKEVLDEGKALIRNDCTMGLTEEKKTFGRKPISSLMLIPMLVKEEPLGIIGLVNSPGGFSGSDLDLCSPFAAQLALSVKKTQLFTEVNSALEEARANAFSFRTIFETAADLILIVNSAGVILKCNSRIQSMLGYFRDEIEGNSIDRLVTFGDIEGIHRLLEYTHQVGSKYNEEYHFLNSKSERIYVEINSAVLNYRGSGDNVLMLVRDITERKIAQEELKYLTLHDPMTGLYNRRYFEEELRRLDVSRHGPITIISCDVDGLKLANDTLGHAKGDEIIKAAAQVIKKPFRSCDVVARIGGDEFAVILPFTNAEVGAKAEERIRNSLDAFNDENPEIPLSFSMGRATSDADTSLEKLFHESDNEMYRHKASRGARSLDAIVKILMLALGEKDFVSRGHVERVQELAVRFGEALALTPVELEQLKVLAQTHDIGKIGISEEILSKSGRLTSEERKELEKHSEIGYRIAASTPELVRVADALVQHHEWWNGEGYPHGLKGEQILLLARMFAIVDAYDAMTSYRPYREPYSPEEALQELRNAAGTQFDPQLVVVFENMLASFSGN